MPKVKQDQIRVLVTNRFKSAVRRAVDRSRLHHSMTSFIIAAVWEKIDRESQKK